MDWMDEVAEKMRRRNQILFSRDSDPAAAVRLARKCAAAHGRALGARPPRGRNRRGISRAHPEDGRPRRAVQAARQWASGSIRMPIAQRNSTVTPRREAASSADAARLHAVAQGCSVVHIGGPCARPAHLRADRARSRMWLERQPKAVELRVLEYVDRPAAGELRRRRHLAHGQIF